MADPIGRFLATSHFYGTREGQAIEAAPLDARLGLPEDTFSYLLQDWDQALAVENPYRQVNTVLARILGLWLRAEARQRDPDHRQTWVLLMDGQPALWDAAADTLGDTPRVEILDLLHATGYLWDAVHLFQPSGTPLATKLMKVLVHALLDGVGTGVIRWLQDLAEQGHLSAAARARLERIHGYFDRHRDRIHDDRYLAAGYPIASGVIEGACRHAVKDRMERAGMHWTLPGAQALLNLRCVTLNDEWEPFMNHYIRQATTRLYADYPVQPPICPAPPRGLTRARSTGYALF